MGKESCVHGKLIPPVLPLSSPSSGAGPRLQTCRSGEPGKPVINFPVLISSRISPSHYEAVRQWVVRMGLHACLARRVVTRRPGAGNCLCPASDELIRGNEINKSRARESRVPQGTNVQAGVPPAEESVPGSQGWGEPCGAGDQGLCPFGATGKGRPGSHSGDARYSLRLGSRCLILGSLSCLLDGK